MEKFSTPEIQKMLDDVIKEFKEDLRKKGHTEEEIERITQEELSRKWTYS